MLSKTRGKDTMSMIWLKLYVELNRPVRKETFAMLWLTRLSEIMRGRPAGKENL